ncbi:leukocyte elastase inhibitor-like [Macrotis lagotis]|uniref:leukocyte elastase inhibitor-like n=1 Tax=Macrotis lagotis TaxID=92651 RepID=UPI003D69689E
MKQLNASNNYFAVNLYKTLAETHLEENIIYSPFSISASLTMIFMGANGETEAKISKVLNFDKVDSSFQNFKSDINKLEISFLKKTAIQLFGEKTYNFLSEFLDSIQRLSGVELVTVDFKHASEDARKEINQWVKEQTEGKIPELLASGEIDKEDVLVLVNAVYFRVNWEEKFDEALTTDALFRLNKREKRSVKMICQKKKLHFGYIKALKCQVLELPYTDNNLSMIILLPDDIEDDSTGLKEIEKQLSMEKLSEWTDHKNMQTIDVCVCIPKFRMENTYNLNSVLTRMGLDDLFTRGKADLSGMSGNKDLFISKIVHKSLVEINEEGTEAAAATAGTSSFAKLMSEKPKKVIADHPFIFIIRHNPTGIFLFFGRFSSP